MTGLKGLLDYRRKIREGLVLAVVFVLPFPQKVSSIVLGLLLVVTILHFLRSSERKRIRVQWFLPTLFLYYLISELISDGTWASMERRLLFIAIPLVLAMNANVFREETKTRAYWTYVLGNVFVALLCLANAVMRSVGFDGGTLKFTPEVIQDPTKDFLTSSVFGGNHFFGHEFSLFMDPMYFGLYIVLAQCMIFELFRTSGNQREKKWLASLYFLLWGALFLLSSKAAIASSLLFSAAAAAYILFKSEAKLVVRLSVLAGLAVVGTLFISFNPRLKVFRETFFERLSINPNARFGHDLRILSWDASLDIIKEHPIFGVGEGKKQKSLSAVYEDKGYIFPARDELNSHNQYLDFLLGGGLIALGLFMTGLLQAVIGAVGERNYLLLSFCLLFAFHGLFENLLSRYAGILFFVVFLTMLRIKAPLDKTSTHSV